MGFTAPAAGKTGTSHDAWYAGFTSNLLCIVWVGNDDYTDIKTELGGINAEGAKAAGPIWADFMKNAVKLPEYSDTKDFVPPAGVIQVSLDNNTNLLADATCPQDYTAAFLEGTQPTDTCDHSMGDQRNLFQKIFGLGQRSVTQAPPLQQQAQHPVPPPKAQPAQPAVAQNPPDQQNPDDKKKKKPGFWGRLFGKKDNSQPQDQNPNQPQ
jgi:penicillin-binding protein 1B